MNITEIECDKRIDTKTLNEMGVDMVYDTGRACCIYGLVTMSEGVDDIMFTSDYSTGEHAVLLHTFLKMLVKGGVSSMHVTNHTAVAESWDNISELVKE